MSDAEVTADWPLYEVFLRGKRGLNHVHVGSLHAADAQMALHHARDLYTRRNEGVSIWVVPSADITASSPDEKDPFFAPSGGRSAPGSPARWPASTRPCPTAPTPARWPPTASCSATTRSSCPTGSS